MNTKEEGLIFVKGLAINKIASRTEVIDAYDSGLESISLAAPKKASVSDVLYFVGALIVSMGAYFLVFNTPGLTNSFKMVFTIGFSLINYGIGVFVNRNKSLESASMAFFLICAALLPTGILFAFTNRGIDIGLASTQIIISAVVFAFFIASHMIMKKNIFIFFSIVFGTWLFSAICGTVLTGAIDWQIYVYETMVIALSYIFLGRFLSKNEVTEPLSGFLYTFGIIGFLGSAMTLAGWTPNQNIFWEILTPILIFATLFYSVTIKSKAFLIFGTLFLMAYIGKITAEYFAQTMTWPIALMICGLLLIGSGYLFVYLKKRYSLN